jgi:hypothetical protein
VRWPYAYLGGDGIFIYDVSDPAQPKRAGSFSGFGTASELDVALDGNFVYSVGPFGLHVTDVSDPTTPRWLGSYKQHGFRSRRVTTKGKYAYAIDYEGAMHVFDVSLPSQPHRVAGNVQINPSMQDNNPFAVGFGLFSSADTLYVAAQNRFSIADIFHNDPAALRITSLQPIVPESARLRLSGPLNTAVGIETSPDLKTWSRLQPFTLGEVPTDIADPSADSTTHFYRLVKD